MEDDIACPAETKTPEWTLESSPTTSRSNRNRRSAKRNERQTFLFAVEPFYLFSFDEIGDVSFVIDASTVHAHTGPMTTSTRDQDQLDLRLFGQGERTLTKVAHYHRLNPPPVQMIFLSTQRTDVSPLPPPLHPSSFTSLSLSNRSIIWRFQKNRSFERFHSGVASSSFHEFCRLFVKS